MNPCPSLTSCFYWHSPPSPAPLLPLCPSFLPFFPSPSLRLPHTSKITDVMGIPLTFCAIFALFLPKTPSLPPPFPLFFVPFMFISVLHFLLITNITLQPFWIKTTWNPPINLPVKTLSWRSEWPPSSVIRCPWLLTLSLDPWALRLCIWSNQACKCTCNKKPAKAPLEHLDGRVYFWLYNHRQYKRCAYLYISYIRNASCACAWGVSLLPLLLGSCLLKCQLIFVVSSAFLLVL